MTCRGNTQRNKPRIPTPCAWLTVESMQETVAYLVRCFERERRRERRSYLFVHQGSGAVYLLADDCPLVDAWVLGRLNDYVGCYFTGRPNRGTDKASFDMPATPEGLAEDLADHMGF